MGLPLLVLPIHIVWLELVLHPTAMLAFQDLPALVPLAPLRSHRRARFFSVEAWMTMIPAAAAFAVIGLTTLGLATRFSHHPD